MNTAADFARRKDESRRLRARADALCAAFPHPGARLRSNCHEVTDKRRRVFRKNRLPTTVLEHPRHWEMRDSHVVLCGKIGRFRAGKAAAWQGELGECSAPQPRRRRLTRKASM